MSRLSCVMMAMVLLACLFLSLSQGSPLLPYRQRVDERLRQEVGMLASRFLRLMSMAPTWEASKRNAGTLDTIINFPDLGEAGRK